MSPEMGLNGDGGHVLALSALGGITDELVLKAESFHPYCFFFVAFGAVEEAIWEVVVVVVVVVVEIELRS